MPIRQGEAAGGRTMLRDVDSTPSHSFASLNIGKFPPAIFMNIEMSLGMLVGMTAERMALSPPAARPAASISREPEPMAGSQAGGLMTTALPMTAGGLPPGEVRNWASFVAASLES